MDLRRLGLGILAVVACSRSSEDAGIVLNVDAEVASDRALIDQVAVNVEGRWQTWALAQPLPGSLGISTSPGAKSVTVQGFASGSLRGTWSGTIVATRGQVIVRDVHLPYAGASVDAGAGAGANDGPRDVGTVDVRDGSAEAAVDLHRDASNADVLGRDGAADGYEAPATDAARDSAKDAADGRADSGDVRGQDGPPSDVDGSLGYDGPAARVTGAFAVSSQFDLQAVAAAPGTVRDTLGLVHGFVTDPGDAILGFADQAGVPAMAALRSVLPDALESRLAGWINSYIRTAVAGISPYDQLVTLDDLVQSLILGWGLESRLALPLNQSGTHAPVSLVFRASVSVPLDATASVTSGTNVVATVTWPDGPGGAAVVSVGDHFIGFPFGRYALQALNTILLADYGVPNIAAYLSNVVGCAGMASSVSSQCVSIVCVGHKDDLLGVCEGGLAEAASQIEDQILGLDFKAIHFWAGSAQAAGVAVSRPQDATSWQNGVWTVTVDLGSGEQPANATFTAAAAASP